MNRANDSGRAFSLVGPMWFSLAFMLLFSAPARAWDDIPSGLREWIPWVLDGHPDAFCPRRNGAPVCVWPGQIDLRIDESGGAFEQWVRVDADIDVPLPGGPAIWPQDVSTDTGFAVVRAKDGRPYMRLRPGTHIVRGRFVWDTAPQGIPLPRTAGLVTLTRDGKRASRVRVDADGMLHLDQSVPGREQAGDTVELDVSRLIQDGVPVQVRTRIDLRVAGGARELNLGAVLLPNTLPVAMDASLPTRIAPNGDVILQVRPGAWTVTIDALHQGEVRSLAAPATTSPAWPSEEYWSVKSDDNVRATMVRGAPSVDPARTPIPSEFSALPAYVLQAGGALTFEEMRRGVPEPPSNALEVRREFWLDADGQGMTVRDSIVGTVSRDWRLDTTPPLALGHVAIDDEDQVVTERGGATGVEVRNTSLQLTAESRIPEIWSPIPAVGWDFDARKLDAKLHLPPGWSLLLVQGVDNTFDGTLVSKWDLLDLLFVAFVAAIVGYTRGRGAGLLAAIAVGASLHTATGTTLLWLGMAIADFARAQFGGPARSAQMQQATQWIHRATSTLLLLALISFAISHLPSRVLPSFTDTSEASYSSELLSEVASITSTDYGRGDYGDSKRYGKKIDFVQSLQVDPAAIVQTGPGVPRWSGTTVQLLWSGTVDRDHTLRLWLVPPIVNKVAAILQWLLWLALAMTITDLGKWLRSPRRMNAALLGVLTLGLLPSPASAAPDAATLASLQERLLRGPDCGADCVVVPNLTVRVREGNPPSLRIVAEVHAAADGTWALPGPFPSWQPDRVLLDGQQTVALTRTEDNFLVVRVPAGVHSLIADGSWTNDDGQTLQFVSPPQRLALDGAGFRLSGSRRDGTVDATIQISREEQRTEGASPRSNDNLAPWVVVRRSLDLGIPWRVMTQVIRHGPLQEPLTFEVPLLSGEAVTDAGVEVRNGRVAVSFMGDQSEVSWVGTLDIAPTLLLQAPGDVPWSEQWIISCSPIFSCTPTLDGTLAPIRHTADGRWQMALHPWPGEGLSLAVARPQGVAGQTETVDYARLSVEPRVRQTHSKLTFHIRTSQGGQHTVQIPADAELVDLTVNGNPVPSRSEGGKVSIPLQPGGHDVSLAFLQNGGWGVAVQVPAIDLGAAAVNVVLEVDHSGTAGKRRWTLLWLGDAYGPGNQLGLQLVGWLLAALVLGHLVGPATGRTPFTSAVWFVLIAGTWLLPWQAILGIVGVILALAYRGRHPADTPGTYNGRQLAILVGILLAAALLAGASLSGLVSHPPSLAAQGNANGAAASTWFVDRSGPLLPTPSLISLPGWAWNLWVLGWTLLVGALVLLHHRWAWAAWTYPHGPWWISNPRKDLPPTPGSAPPSPPSPQSSPPSAPANGASGSGDTNGASGSGDTSGASGSDDLDVATIDELPTVIHRATVIDRRPRGEIFQLHREGIEARHDADILDNAPLLDEDEPNDADFDIEDDELNEDDEVVTLHVGVRLGPPPKRGVAVEKPYDVSKHIEMEPPSSAFDNIFIPSIDADPADYRASTRPPAAYRDDD